MPSSSIRPFQAQDAQRVANIFQKVFRHTAAPAPAALVEQFREVYLAHPAQDPDLASLVHERQDGTVDGFIGAIPQPMLFKGRKLRGVVSGTFMVENPAASPTAGGRLFRRMLNGPQDITITDNANRRSLDFQRAMHCQTLDLQSLQWTKILNWVDYALSVIGERTWRLPVAPLRHIVHLFGSPLVTKRGSEARGRRLAWHDADIDAESFSALFGRFIEAFELCPDWTRGQLLWLLEQAAHKTKVGRLFMRGVFRENGEPIGAYLYFARPGADGIALQIVTEPDMAEFVLESLFEHAAKQGCTVVRGSAQPYLMNGLFRSENVMLRHASITSVRTRDPELLQAARTGTALIGGLVGEGWTRLVSDDFAGAER